MKKRFVALDILRGLTVAFMCIVNNPGTWSKLYAPLKHAPWDGCTPTDLVFPFFVFCMGCAMAFSLAGYDSLSRQAAWKILKRGALIFLVGVLLNLYPFYPYKPHDEAWTFGQNYLYWLQHKRILGVLQRIGMCYIIAGMVILALKKNPVRIAWAVLGLFTVWTVVMVIGGGEGGPFSIQGTWAPKADIAIFGEEHLYRRYATPDGGSRWFDPEGVWGALTGACTALVGFLAGSLVRTSRARYTAGSEGISSSRLIPPAPWEADGPFGIVAKLCVGGLGLLAAGMILSIWIPINKALWTPSYVLYAGGWATIALGVISYLTDVKGWEQVFTPAKAMGMNALTAFVLSGLIAKTFGWIGWGPAKYFRANEFTSLCYALLFMLVIFSVQWILYKKKILIKL